MPGTSRLSVVGRVCKRCACVRVCVCVWREITASLISNVGKVRPQIKVEGCGIMHYMPDLPTIHRTT